MSERTFGKLPNHIGIIPDGNRRWAASRGMGKENGYDHGLNPGHQLYELSVKLGISELTLYGFTQDNTKRPSAQTVAFTKACVDAVRYIKDKDASLLVVGDTSSPLFPDELRPYTGRRHTFGRDIIRINFLVNYGWKWDLEYPFRMQREHSFKAGSIHRMIASRDISRIDLIIRWGGHRRLSGFLPVQTIYSDMYVVDAMWPDFEQEHFYQALEWYQDQDVTLGG